MKRVQGVSTVVDEGLGFPRLYAAASLKRLAQEPLLRLRVRFPRLYAAASLKRKGFGRRTCAARGFPRLYAAASLKLDDALRPAQQAGAVFRGFMPRPH